MLAVLATLALIADLALEHVSPDTQMPSIEGSRTQTRFVLAGRCGAAGGEVHVLNLSHIGDLGSGFWFGAVVAAALVYAAMTRMAGGAGEDGRPAEPPRGATTHGAASDEIEPPKKAAPAPQTWPCARRAGRDREAPEPPRSQSS